MDHAPDRLPRPSSPPAAPRRRRRGLPHAPRARAHAPRLAILGILAASLAAGCGPPGETAAATEDWSAEVERLVADLTPLPPDAYQSDEGAWKQRRLETLEELRRAPEGLGRAVWERARDDESLSNVVRAGMYDVAAHAAPDACLDELDALFHEYGPDLHLRIAAGEALAAAAPARAIESFRPLLTTASPGKTYPSRERVLLAYLEAASETGYDPVDDLCAIGTDLLFDDPVRMRAVKALRDYPDARGRDALHTVLVESTGNGNLRLYAMQSLLYAYPGEETCAKLLEVLAREADQNFALALTRAIESNCP